MLLVFLGEDQVPPSIVNFERLYLGGLVIALISLSWVQPNGHLGYDALIGIMVTFTLLMAGLGLMASRGRSTIAKWLVTAMFALSLTNSSSFFAGTASAEIMSLSALFLLAHAIAIALLFTRTSRDWFSQGSTAFASLIGNAIVDLGLLAAFCAFIWVGLVKDGNAFVIWVPGLAILLFFRAKQMIARWKRATA